MGGCISPPAQATPGHQKRVHALYDYNARTENDLSFKEGDILLLLDQHEEDEDWCYAQHTGLQYNNQKMEGYVPRNYVALEDTQVFLGKEANIQNQRLLKVNSRVTFPVEDTPAIPCEPVTQPAPLTQCSVEQTVASIPGPQPVIPSTNDCDQFYMQKFVTAQCDYNAESENELSFKKDDILILLDDAHDTDQTLKQGFNVLTINYYVHVQYTDGYHADLHTYQPKSPHTVTKPAGQRRIGIFTTRRRVSNIYHAYIITSLLYSSGHIFSPCIDVTRFIYLYRALLLCRCIQSHPYISDNRLLRTLRVYKYLPRRYSQMPS
ncbi:uncharacterized protein LOC127848698 isoform X3 [Dreissena polymorpha]|uniref:uncharacterized protein LOC127848698 isoform X3 n=1 Tax=Dreissena polymorpha TaxID=45954 RepID=UPI00226473C9|nr:uncharacterized protein LOC127848698 isoform X3 [Dreissena polymorpha]